MISTLTFHCRNAVCNTMEDIRAANGATFTYTQTHTKYAFTALIVQVFFFSPCGFKVRPGWFCVIRKAFSFILWQVWNVMCTAAVHEHTLKSSLSLCVFASMCALPLLMMAPKRENPHHHQILLLMSVVPAKGLHSLPLSFCLLWFFLTINMLKSPVGQLLRSVHLSCIWQTDSQSKSLSLTLLKL